MPTPTAKADSTNDTATADAVLVWLDPNTLVPNPDNPRKDFDNIDGLTASIRELGVRQALTVWEVDGVHVIEAGERRQRASIAAGLTLVPCMVTAAEGDRAVRIAAALAENGHATRIGLTEAEEVGAVQLLLAEGWSQARIGRATGDSRKRVRQLVAVAKDETATAVMGRFANVTLEQAQVIASFSDDTDDVKALTVAAEKDPYSFEHVASRIARRREDDAARAVTLAGLAEAGVTILDEDEHPNAMPLHRLRHDGQQIEVEAHASCPGHIAEPSEWNPDEVDYFCADPAANGHEDRYTFTGGTAEPGERAGKMTDEQKAERREVIANNKAAGAAKPVRLAYLANLLARRTAPAGTMRFLALATISRASLMTGVGEDDVAAVLGTDPTPGYHYGASPTISRLLGEATTDKRIAVVTLIQVVAGIEKVMGRQFWRHAGAFDAAYLSFLSDTGYTLSEVEQLVVDNHNAEDDVE